MPKRFVFNLEVVLDQRKALEEVEQRKVAALELERISIEDRIRTYQRAISTAKQDLRTQLGSARGGGGAAVLVSPEAVRMQAAASFYLVARAQEGVLELARLHRRLDAARLELLRAATARKSVESLRAKRLEEWRVQAQRAEAQEMDELSVMRHRRTYGPTDVPSGSVSP